MAKIRFPIKALEKYIKIDEKTINQISMFGTPAELCGEELEVEIFPNRPDMLSMQGFLRAFSTYAGKERGIRKYKINKPEKNFKVKIDSSLKNIRPYTACAIVKNLKFNDERIKEIIDMQEKLHITVGRNRKKLAIGIYPLEKITLPIKFEARKPSEIKFVPLEMNRELNGLQILRDHPTGRDYAKLLEGLDKFPVFVDANNKILSMPPIINSHETGKIDEKTKDVFVECSGFDFEVLKKTLNIIVTTLADMGGEIYAMELDYGKKEITPNLEPEEMKISIENVNKLIGLDLNEKDIGELLMKMGYEYKNKKVLVPAWRSDILHEVDLIEDIAIAYGYDKLVPEIPKVATIGEESYESKFISKVAESLVGLGFIETSSYHLIKAEEADSMICKETIELENSKSEYKLLRYDLMTPLLRVLAENRDNEYPQKIFELGTTFELDKSGEKESGIEEKQKLALSI
jgi:phenylalanyl-tRNA synthetase beta chain